jgi:hypothetical protein
MKPLPPVPEPGCSGESLKVLAEESEIAKAIHSVLFEPPKPPPSKKRRSSEKRSALAP